MAELALDPRPVPLHGEFSASRERLRFGLPAALLLHLLLVVAAGFAPALRPPAPPPEEAIPVVLLRPDQMAAPSPPPSAPPLLSAPATQPVARAPAAQPPPKESEPPMITATRMMADQVLANPKSRKAVADLATLAGSERMLQLCDLEAMEQIHAWRSDLRPELLVPYATGNERMTGTTIVADGAAFFSEHRWYGARYDCTLSRDGRHVVALRFQVEDEIPQDRWSDLGLPSGSAME